MGLMCLYKAIRTQVHREGGVKTQGEDSHLQGKKKGLIKNLPLLTPPTLLLASRFMKTSISVAETTQSTVQ